MPVDVSFDRLRDAARERWGHLTVISVDTVFLEYVHVMISNGKSPRKLQEDLSVFLEDDTDAFCEWLTDALATTALAGSPPAPAAATKQEARRPSGSSQSEPAPQSEIHRETRRRPANEQTARASTRLVASAVSEAVESSTQSSNSRAAVTRKGRDLKSRIGPVKRTHQDLKDSHDGGDHSTGALPSSVPARLRGRLGEVPQQRMDERTEEYEYEQEEEEGEEEEVGYDEGSRKRAKTTGQQQRCSFWPACTKQDCPFVHPTQVCKLFPKCPYGDRKCLFVHPAVPCRFGVLCTNPNCRFAHPPKQKHRPSVRAAPPTSKPTPQFQLCRFGPACTRPACPFQHLQKATAPTAETPDTSTSATSSVLCRFHPHCSRRPACPFLHPTSSSRHKSLLLVNNRPHAITDKPPQQLIPAESEPQNVDKSAAFIPLSE